MNHQLAPLSLMAKSSIVKVLEQSKVSPPPNSIPSSTSNIIPLTFFDIPWLFFSPSQPLFFYEYQHPVSHFLSTTLPGLKHSLSLTLQHLFPFAGNLVLPSQSHKPSIVYYQGDCVSLTVAESNLDFKILSGNHPRGATDFHSLVPDLTSNVSSASVTVNQVDNVFIPLLAVQLTIFPNVGICIGLAYHHVVADGRTFNNFMKTWASFCRDSSFRLNTLPSYDRTVIIDRHGLEEIFLNEWCKTKSSKETIFCKENDIDLSDIARGTFVVGSSDMEKIKSWIVAQCKMKHRPLPVHLSPYVLTCSFVWVCLVKAKAQEFKSESCFAEDPNYFGFNAGGITRLDYSVPTSYFGNCIGFGRSMVTRRELLSEDGIIVAANAIGNTIKKLDKAMFGGADKWISDWEVLVGSELHVMVSGSPKLDLYKTDFGWGRPKKIEEISIDRTRAISLTESRDFEGGIEVGLALPNLQLDAFTFLFNGGLKLLQQCSL